MTKTELFNKVSEVLELHNVKKGAREEILALLEVKKGGAQLDVNEVAVFDAEGVITHLLDINSGMWFPIELPEGGSAFFPKEGSVLGFARYHRLTDKLRLQTLKQIKASKEGILNDVLAGVITVDEAKAETTKLDTVKPDYTEVISFCGATEDKPA